MMMMMMIIMVMIVGTRLLNGGSSPRLGGRQPTLRADGFTPKRNKGKTKRKNKSKAFVFDSLFPLLALYM